MKLVQEDKLFEETIADVFEASGSLFVMPVQLMALQTLLWNPELYVEKLKEGRATTNFKAEPCQREMREYLFGQIITNKTHDDRDHYRGQGAALWDKERERPSTSMRRGTGRSRKRSRSPSPRVAATRSRSPRRRDRDTASWEERSDRGSPQRDSPSPPRRSTGTKPYVRKASSKPAAYTAAHQSSARGNRTRTTSRGKSNTRRASTATTTRMSRADTKTTSLPRPPAAVTSNKTYGEEEYFSGQDDSPIAQRTPSPDTSESEEMSLPLASAIKRKYKVPTVPPSHITITSDDQQLQTYDEEEEEEEEQEKVALADETTHYDPFDLQEDEDEHAIFITQNKFLQDPRTGEEDDDFIPTKKQRTSETTPKKQPTTSKVPTAPQKPRGRGVPARRGAPAARGARGGRGTRGTRGTRGRASTTSTGRQPEKKINPINKHIFFK